MNRARTVTMSSPDDVGFLIGLGFFLLAHVVYATLFLRRLRMRRFRPLAFAYAAWWLMLLLLLAPHHFLPGFVLWQADFLIMLGYLVAQGLIAFGVLRWAWALRRSDPAPAGTTAHAGA